MMKFQNKILIIIAAVPLMRAMNRSFSDELDSVEQSSWGKRTTYQSGNSHKTFPQARSFKAIQRVEHSTQTEPSFAMTDDQKATKYMSQVLRFLYYFMAPDFSITYREDPLLWQVVMLKGLHDSWASIKHMPQEEREEIKRQYGIFTYMFSHLDLSKLGDKDTLLT